MRGRCFWMGDVAGEMVGRSPPYGGQSCMRHKSFLLLFFKKEGLVFV
jgi:hypothetical protein